MMLPSPNISKNNQRPVYSLQRDQASLDSFRHEYELGVKAHAERCEAASLTTVAAALTRLEAINLLPRSR